MRSSSSYGSRNLLTTRPYNKKVPPKNFLRPVIAPIWIVVAVSCAVIMTLFWNGVSHAQTPRNFRVPPTELPDLESTDEEADITPDSTPTLRKVIVDTDPGVDDAAALIWLFSQPRYPVQVLGVVAVAGNTSVENAANNAQLILNWLGQTTVPVIQGANAPLLQPLSLVPSLVHGLDGLWFISTPQDPPDSLDAMGFYCAPNRLQPGVIVLALGPLTNIALALDECPGAWGGVEIVSLGGGKLLGNQTPVSEYNYWQDPEAAAQVLADAPRSGASLQIVPIDAFSQFELEPNDIRKLRNTGVPAIVNLLPALEIYIETYTTSGEAATLPDYVATIYALENKLGTEQSALVKVLTDVPEVARGQTIIGLGLTERITMIASDAELSNIALSIFTVPGFDLDSALFNILMREPDNAFVVVDIDANRMHNQFLKGLRSNESLADFENHVFVPLIID